MFSGNPLEKSLYALDIDTIPEKIKLKRCHVKQYERLKELTGKNLIYQTLMVAT